MLATSWKVQGELVAKAWKRLDPPTRDHLAELTGISKANLSGYNTGRLPMTLSIAERICEVVPNLTVFDLGAREVRAEDGPPLLLIRQDELAEKLAGSIEKQIALDLRVQELEAFRKRVEGDSTDQAGDP